MRVRVEDLDAAVLGHLADDLFSVTRCKEILKDVADNGDLVRKRIVDQRRSVQAQIRVVDGKIAKWTTAFEDGDADDVKKLVDAVGLDRLRQLKEQRAELEASLTKVGPIPTMPTQLVADHVVNRFRAKIREVFMGADRGLARAYLQALVERIHVWPDHVDIYARKATTVRFIAQKEEAGDGPLPLVPISGLGWLRHLGSNQGPCD